MEKLIESYLIILLSRKRIFSDLDDDVTNPPTYYSADI